MKGTGRCASCAIADAFACFECYAEIQATSPEGMGLPDSGNFEFGSLNMKIQDSKGLRWSDIFNPSDKDINDTCTYQSPK